METSRDTYDLVNAKTYTFDNVTLIGPTTQIVQSIITHIEVVSNATTTASKISQPWDLNPYLVPSPTSPNDTGPNSAAVAAAKSFGRDPACTVAFSSWTVSSSITMLSKAWISAWYLLNGQYTGEAVRSIETGPIANLWGDIDLHCCGVCKVALPTLQVFYWPALHPNTACLGSSLFDSIPSSNTFPNSSVYATVNGHT